ncbi:MAG TPA: rod shape-determining protein MreC [Chitinophagales bacterium]|nr:rod shape-determining protein MreC [Chitinophagales bacterium]
MRNLFLFLYRYHAFFLFLLLQIVCLYLIIENNSFQRAAFYNVSDEVVGRTMTLYHEVTGYITLGEENKKLVEENARLHNMLPSVSYTDTSRVYVARDSSRHQFYTYIPARVIQTSTNLVNNYIVINKGSKAGIEPRMAVVGPDGVVGIVKNVSLNFSSLFSLLHSQVTVSARVRRDGSRGTIRWYGGSPDFVNLEEITRQETLHKGDTIFTSGVSRIFPDNIPIGTVDEFKLKEPGNFYTIRVKLATNYRKIDYAYVVNNMLHEEMDSLLKKTENAQ